MVRKYIDITNSFYCIDIKYDDTLVYQMQCLFSFRNLLLLSKMYFKVARSTKLVYIIWLIVISYYNFLNGIFLISQQKLQAMPWFKPWTSQSRAKHLSNELRCTMCLYICIFIFYFLIYFISLKIYFYEHIDIA